MGQIVKVPAVTVKIVSPKRLDAGVDMGWVARQAGHSSFKMICEHDDKYLKRTIPAANFWPTLPVQKQNALKIGHKLATALRAVVKMVNYYKQINGREDWI